MVLGNNQINEWCCLQHDFTLHIGKNVCLKQPVNTRTLGGNKHIKVIHKSTKFVEISSWAYIFLTVQKKYLPYYNNIPVLYKLCSSVLEFRGEVSVEEEKGNSSMCYKAYRQAILRNSLIHPWHMAKKLKSYLTYYTLKTLWVKFPILLSPVICSEGTYLFQTTLARKMFLHLHGKVQY